MSVFGHGPAHTNGTKLHRTAVRKSASDLLKCHVVAPARGNAWGLDDTRGRSADVAKPTLAERFWAKVDKTETCWVWTASRNNRGYGMLQDGARYRTAHRISWELHYGAIPAGLHVLHRCDNPPCIRPDHLFLGTHADNMRDCGDKDRFARGDRNRVTKLTAAQVRIIKRRLANGERSPVIAPDYGVSANLIRRISRGERWRGVGEP